MAKCFNVSQRERTTAIASRKRSLHGDPVTGKLKIRQKPHSVSGKRQRKLLMKGRREHKEALENGLLTMEDVVEMAATDEDLLSSHHFYYNDSWKKIVSTTWSSVHLKKQAKFRKKIHLKRRVKVKGSGKQKGEKNKHKSTPNASSSDAMVE